MSTSRTLAQTPEPYVPDTSCTLLSSYAFTPTSTHAGQSVQKYDFLPITRAPLSSDSRTTFARQLQASHLQSVDCMRQYLSCPITVTVRPASNNQGVVLYSRHRKLLTPRALLHLSPQTARRSFRNSKCRSVAPHAHQLLCTALHIRMDLKTAPLPIST